MLETLVLISSLFITALTVGNVVSISVPYLMRELTFQMEEVKWTVMKDKGVAGRRKVARSEVQALLPFYALGVGASLCLFSKEIAIVISFIFSNLNLRVS